MKTLLTRFALIATLSVLMIGCSTVGRQRRLLEYQVDTVWVKAPSPLKQFQEYLNAKAKDGWKLVGFEEHDNNFRVVLSRPKK